MKTTSNKYLIAVPKEQTFSNTSLIVPIHKGTEETTLRPVSGIVKALPGKLTKQFGIASNTGTTMLNAALLEKSMEKVKEDSEVYISYMATDKDNFLYSDENFDYYVVPIHHLIAVATKKGFEAVSGKVIIRPLQMAEFKSKVLISPNQVKNIGFGVVVSCAEGMREYYGVGQTVVYLEKLAEWIEINGEKYDFVYTGEILATMPQIDEQYSDTAPGLAKAH